MRTCSTATDQPLDLSNLLISEQQSADKNQCNRNSTTNSVDSKIRLRKCAGLSMTACTDRVFHIHGNLAWEVFSMLSPQTKLLAYNQSMAADRLWKKRGSLGISNYLKVINR